MQEKQVLCREALLGWCKSTLGYALVPHKVIVAFVGHMVR